MIKVTFQCDDCDTVTNHHRCDYCGSHNVHTVTTVNMAIRKPKKDDYK